MDSRWLVPIRLGIAGIILLVYCMIKYKKRILKPWHSFQSVIYLLIYGVAGVSTCQFLYFLTIELSTASIGTILQDLAPIFILIVTCVLTKRLPKANELISILLAIAGVFMLTTHGNIETMSVSSVAIIAGVGSAFCVMIYNILAPKVTFEIPVIIVQGWSFLLGGIFGMFVFQSWKIHYVPNIYGVIGIIFVVVVGNICAFTFYITGVKSIGPSKAILYSFAEPITAAIISTIVLHNVFTIYDATGFLLIFAMLYMITFVGDKADETKKNKHVEEGLLSKSRI